MKIVYLAASGDISGGQRVIQQAEGIAKWGYDVTLVCPEPKPTWFPIQQEKIKRRPLS